ncbi:hypothetical protein [Fodinicola acaciae]|uniref:hypothetical protein n=1 Tax=Fodinicola acaciae TaxID=2681555 RepID=UPI0013D5D2FB|nr:hypothetical protein [Fodinicola acaciae]
MTDLVLAAYLRIPRRGWAAIGGCALIGLLAGVAVLLGQPASFRATVPILVADQPVAVVAPGQGTAKWITVDTEARRVTSEDVLAEISRATGDGDPLAHLDLGAVPGTKVLTIGYRSGSAAQAVAGVSAAVKGYLTARTDFLLARRSAAVAALSGNVDRLVAELGDTPKNAAGKAARQQLYRRIGELQTAMVNSANLGVYAGDALRTPSVAAEGTANRPVPLVSGAVLGALAGLWFARRTHTLAKGKA